MWTMTPQGFFSAVQHNDDPTLLVVRTRDRADADRLCDWYEDWIKGLSQFYALNEPADHPDPMVVAYPVSDYPWRVILPRTAFGAFMAEAVEDLNYGNFKDAVKNVQGPERANVYTNVWAALRRLEDLDPLGRRPAVLDDSDWGPYDAWEADGNDDVDWNDEDAMLSYFQERGWTTP